MNFDFRTVPLTQLPPGGGGRVWRVLGGRGMALRLARLGIRPGAAVRLVNAGPWRGPLLVEVEGVRVALGRGVASRILVRPLP
ncbi:TPA: ferrous iron transport protein A [Candidatus Acetothermia bacterium]|nr:ferrous iron transport protein A [Candidatus Acetothermia bacterium]